MVVLLPETNSVEATRLAERLRKSVEQLHIETAEYKNLQVTVSVGVACIQPNPGETSLLADTQRQFIGDDLIAKAGHALHIAKQQGRNRVVVYEAEL